VRTDDFDYELPPELIAQHPSERRDESRLLVLDRASGAIEHKLFRDVVDYLAPGDLLVVNDTKVVPARLVGHRGTGGRVELLLIAPSGEATAPGAGSVWRAMAKCRGRLVAGESIAVEGGVLVCIYRGRTAEGDAIVEFDLTEAALREALEQVGRAPLPPYIKRPREDDPDRAVDLDRYQTVYAARPGAIAAPTAGLHFTPAVFERLGAKGVGRATVTLHVGLGTFRPVKVERVEDHEMHTEWFELSREAADAVSATRAAGGRVVPVGTTATRVLESAAQAGEWGPMSGWTDLFVTPGYEFRVADALITNFHLPCSTLLMLVSALAGRERVLAAYEEAKRLGYRFYSYGDAMLIV